MLTNQESTLALDRRSVCWIFLSFLLLIICKIKLVTFTLGELTSLLNILFRGEKEN